MVILTLEDPDRWISREGDVEIVQRFNKARMDLDTNYSTKVDVSVRLAESDS